MKNLELKENIWDCQIKAFNLKKVNKHKSEKGEKFCEKSFSNFNLNFLQKDLSFVDDIHRGPIAGQPTIKIWTEEQSA